MWRSGLGVVPQIEESPVHFQVRAHAWVVGQVPGWGCVRGNRLMFLLHTDVSPPLFLHSFLFLKINKIFFEKKEVKVSIGSSSKVTFLNNEKINS